MLTDVDIGVRVAGRTAGCADSGRDAGRHPAPTAVAGLASGGATPPLLPRVAGTMHRSPHVAAAARLLGSVERLGSASVREASPRWVSPNYRALSSARGIPP